MDEPKVSVAILNDPQIQIELSGEYLIKELDITISGPISAAIENDKIKLTGNRILHAAENEFNIEPVDSTESSFLIKDVVIGIDFHWQKKEDQRFKGSLRLIKEKGNITAVNVINVEEYLMSVISSEMSATSSEELLKAHSIISRSWLIAQIQKSDNLKKSDDNKYSFVETEDKLIKWFDREDHVLYDVCADDHCQRYQGITKIISDKSKKAIEFTRGMLLTYEGEICDARYSKSCGGVSENFELVWEPVEYPYLKKVIDYSEDTASDFDLTLESDAEKWIKGNPPAFCNTHDEKILSQVLLDFDQTTKDFYRWKVEYTQEEISGLVNKNLGDDFGEILDLIPVSRGVSGRLIELKIVGSRKTLTIGKELIIRKTFSNSHLYSSAFVVEKHDVENKIPGKFVLLGAGWGHGVGLCQIGAAVMGEKGYKFDEILLHYFKGAELKKLYS